MVLLSERDRRAIQERLQEMEGPVKLLNFTQELECPTCRETGQLLQKLATLSDNSPWTSTTSSSTRRR